MARLNHFPGLSGRVHANEIPQAASREPVTTYPPQTLHNILELLELLEQPELLDPLELTGTY